MNPCGLSYPNWGINQLLPYGSFLFAQFKITNAMSKMKLSKILVLFWTSKKEPRRAGAEAPLMKFKPLHPLMFPPFSPDMLLMRHQN